MLWNMCVVEDEFFFFFKDFQLFFYKNLHEGMIEKTSTTN